MADVVLVSDRSDCNWVEALGQATSSLGKSMMLTDHQCLGSLSLEGCKLVIIDTGAKAVDVISAVQCIRSKDQYLRIVVVSSTPHWKQARDALLAGATDYRRKTDDSEDILEILRGGSPRATVERGSIS
jgi:DNA-binding NtrC family response regulator